MKIITLGFLFSVFSIFTGFAQVQIENNKINNSVNNTTSCTGVDAINENFDAAIAPALPDCWTSILRGETISASGA